LKQAGVEIKTEGARQGVWREMVCVYICACTC